MKYNLLYPFVYLQFYLNNSIKYLKKYKYWNLTGYKMVKYVQNVRYTIYNFRIVSEVI